MHWIGLDSTNPELAWSRYHRGLLVWPK